MFDNTYKPFELAYYMPHELETKVKPKASTEVKTDSQGRSYNTREDCINILTTLMSRGTLSYSQIQGRLSIYDDERMNSALDFLKGIGSLDVAFDTGVPDRGISRDFRLDSYSFKRNSLFGK